MHKLINRAKYSLLCSFATIALAFILLGILNSISSLDKISYGWIWIHSFLGSLGLITGIYLVRLLISYFRGQSAPVSNLEQNNLFPYELPLREEFAVTEGIQRRQPHKCQQNSCKKLKRKEWDVSMASNNRKRFVPQGYPRDERRNFYKVAPTESFDNPCDFEFHLALSATNLTQRKLLKDFAERYPKEFDAMIKELQLGMRSSSGPLAISNISEPCEIPMKHFYEKETTDDAAAWSFNELFIPQKSVQPAEYSQQYDTFATNLDPNGNRCREMLQNESVRTGDFKIGKVDISWRRTYPTSTTTAAAIRADKCNGAVDDIDTIELCAVT